MSIKASVSLTEPQNAFARDLVSQGRYPSLSAVVQKGLELLRQETEMHDAELSALKNLLQGRAADKFVPVEDGREETEAMIAEKRRQHGL